MLNPDKGFSYVYFTNEDQANGLKEVLENILWEYFFWQGSGLWEESEVWIASLPHNYFRTAISHVKPYKDLWALAYRHIPWVQPYSD